jgi:hypothetical protein
MRSSIGLLAALVLLAGCGSATPTQPPRFGPRVDNPWFPLRPGTVYVYTGVKDGRPSRDIVRVTHATRTIQGVRATAVDDRLYVRGALAERTTDWYAQDRAGNVWYLGEDTAELDRGGRVTSTEGTWRAGVAGARAGILMPAHPHPGQAGIQEVYRGHAEDHFRVLRVSGDRLVTEEWTPLEPGVLDHKHYARGIGTVREETVRGGDERNVLVRVRRG